MILANTQKGFAHDYLLFISFVLNQINVCYNLIRRSCESIDLVTQNSAGSTIWDRGVHFDHLDAKLSATHLRLSRLKRRRGHAYIVSGFLLF